MRGAMRRSLSIMALIVFAGLASACSQSEATGASPATGGFDVSRLPRVTGAKQVFASPFSTIFTAPGSVKDTAATVRSTLVGLGWQSYVRPYSARIESENMTIMSFKKGPQALSVMVGLAPAQNNATSVNYNAVALPADLPFPKDATAIEYDYDGPELICLTTEAIEPTLDYYRKELGALGWSLWSAKLGDKQPPGGRNGELTQKGGYAYYTKTGKKPLVLTLQTGPDSKLKIQIKSYPMEMLETEHRAAVNVDMRAKGLPVAEAPPPTVKPAPAKPIKSAAEVHADMMKEVHQTLSKATAQMAAPAKTASNSVAMLQDVPRPRADNSLPIPLPETAVDIAYKAENEKLEFNSQTSVTALATFYRDEMKRLGWRERRSVINRPNMVVLDFLKAKLKLMVTIIQLGKHANVSADGSILATAKPKVQLVAHDAALKTAATKRPPVPLPADAQELDYDADRGAVDFNSASPIKAVTAFYRAELKRQGWKEASPAIERPNIAVLNYAKDDDGLSFMINQTGDKTIVSVNGSALKTAAAKAVPPSPEDLEVTETAGLPVPKAHTMAMGEQTGVRKAVKAEVGLPLAATLDFYRRELGKRKWQEQSKGAVVAADRAVIAFTAPDGPAVLKLSRKSGRTMVELSIKDAARAAKSGMLPKPGQAKILLGNMLPTDATVTIRGQTIRIKAGAGAKAPDGPTLDLPPGKYKYSLKAAGVTAETEEIEVAADETWGLLVAPGGMMPMHVY